MIGVRKPVSRVSGETRHRAAKTTFCQEKKVADLHHIISQREIIMSMSHGKSFKTG